MTEKTCDKCVNYTPTDMPDFPQYIYGGSCALMGDSNGQNPVVAIDRVSGFDYESYQAGCYVGPKFGCIHWSKKP